MYNHAFTINMTPNVIVSLKKDLVTKNKKYVRLSFMDTRAGPVYQLALDETVNENDRVHMVSDLPFIFTKWEESYMNDLIIMMSKFSNRYEVY